jgi:hypothetical protein
MQNPPAGGIGKSPAAGSIGNIFGTQIPPAVSGGNIFGKRILPTHDLAFRTMISSPQCAEIPCGLVNDFVDLPFPVNPETLTITNPFSFQKGWKQILLGMNEKGQVQTTEEPQLREIIRDAAFTLNDGTFIFIEMQNYRHLNLEERIQAYSAKRYADSQGIDPITRNPAENKYGYIRPVLALPVYPFRQPLADACGASVGGSSESSSCPTAG